MKYKKAQSALEFSIIFTFILVIMVFVSYFIGIYLIGVEEKNQQNIRDDVAKLIITEFEIFQRVDSGFSRNITIPKHLVDSYNFTFYQDQFTIQNREFTGDDTLFVYDLPGRNIEGISFNYSVGSNGIGVLIFEKPYEEIQHGLVLN